VHRQGSISSAVDFKKRSPVRSRRLSQGLHFAKFPDIDKHHPLSAPGRTTLVASQMDIARSAADRRTGRPMCCFRMESTRRGHALLSPAVQKKLGARLAAKVRDALTCPIPAVDSALKRQSFIFSQDHLIRPLNPTYARYSLDPVLDAGTTEWLKRLCRRECRGPAKHFRLRDSRGNCGRRKGAPAWASQSIFSLTPTDKALTP